MIRFHAPPVSPFLLQKMNHLCSILWQEKKEFEQIAGTITNRDLRNTMLTLAQEINQYAYELCSQIHTLGGVPDMENKGPGLGEEIRNLIDENEIQIMCKMNENKMIDAYREILNESLLYEGLRQMVRYQLNEMLCAFMHVKQLHALKLHKQSLKTESILV